MLCYYYDCFISNMLTMLVSMPKVQLRLCCLGNDTVQSKASFVFKLPMPTNVQFSWYLRKFDVPISRCNIWCSVIEAKNLVNAVTNRWPNYLVFYGIVMSNRVFKCLPGTQLFLYAADSLLSIQNCILMGGLCFGMKLCF